MPEATPNVDWWRIHATSYIKLGNYFIFVGELGGKFIGFADFFLFPEPATGKIHCVGQHFYVLPEYRNTNLAGKLYKKFFMVAKQCKAVNLEIFCFEKEKPFWEKHNFELKRIMMRRKAG